MFLDPASFSCTADQSNHSMKNQSREAEVSGPNGSVPERRLRLSEDRPLGTGKERQRFKVGIRVRLSRPGLGSAALGASVVSPLALPALRPGLISTCLGSAVPVSLSVQWESREAGILRAHVQTVSLGVRGHGEGRGQCWVRFLALKSVVKRNGP